MTSSLAWVDGLQEVFQILVIRALWLVELQCIHDLDDPRRVDLVAMGFIWLLDMPHIWLNHELLTALTKWWHNKHNTFHLPTGDASITLENDLRFKNKIK